MANVYVYSGAGGAGTGADWTNAYTTLAAAYTAKAAGDDFWVAHDHSETPGSANTVTCPGTAASPCRTICVNRAGSVPPVSADLRTTAVVGTSGAFTFSWASGHSYIEGIIFQAASGSSNGSVSLLTASTDGFMDMVNCGLVLNTTSTLPRINFGTTSAPATGRVRMRNCTVTFGNASQALTMGSCQVEWTGTASAVAGTAPTILIKAGTARPGSFIAQGVDLSTVTGTLVDQIPQRQFFDFIDCKLGSGVTLAAAPTSLGDAEARITRGGSTTTYARQEKVNYLGTETTETTIVRTGSENDYNIGAKTARKIVTTANAKPWRAFKSMPLGVINPTTAANVTLTAYGIWGGGAVPNNDDIWIEAWYMGDAATPMATRISSGKADVLATGAAVSSDGSSWGGSTTAFKMSVTMSSPQPQKAGLIYVFVFCGAASTTFYVDPVLVLS